MAKPPKASVKSGQFDESPFFEGFERMISGTYNRGNTTVYNFDSAPEPDDFKSRYLPTTDVTDLPAIHTEDTVISHRFLTEQMLIRRSVGIRQP